MKLAVLAFVAACVPSSARCPDPCRVVDEARAPGCVLACSRPGEVLVFECDDAACERCSLLLERAAKRVAERDGCWPR